ncbi:S-adenosylmethionine synthase [Mycoplasmopsis agalactiae]|uniref:S-adenosylmethionine synthase n=1 Tax=Mycoplasmopsis agalactiae (strain NCTC 10123 / CIP 59.7 / PG2) TaxID=347257 RepID=A5IZ21_MYCAP|nr:methionine adenosyltransferase [Mycoplasmopsis agalactiae]MCE6057312.1 methionine adenosyltransferase [Mycoplasmopsis agalactiae]MCE6079096.1 methionine adenosyltransferase [Mycoplasmopsis agalactiae]MCE6095484.1 methionine adenosyltransferase [Mycoplasmopsis agalactiae]MCE6114738.1 methionine adenosyltransferase [Mycoplasmopsis agalactiae]NLS34189.1 methionine adenosyltransferase [Mycoplasmopsis agalactiae]
MSIKRKVLFTSESVGLGHPDKICDQISDAVIDEFIKQDPYSRLAIETVASGNQIYITGEVASNATVDIKDVALKTIFDIDKDYQINVPEVILNIKKQSDDIAQGVLLDDDEIGAGDQGIMFGYATNETPEYMPLAITLAHRIVQKASELIKSGEFKHAKSDMKSQVTLDFSEEKVKVDTVLFSCQHDENFDEKSFKTVIKEKIIYPIMDEYNMNMPSKILINPTGRFVIGGIVGDAGLTGRKIIVDTYGGTAHHGGGAFSGKDATKVDRSAAYACRWIAKNLVAAKVADKLEIQVSYAIGVAEPVSIFVDTFGTNKVSNESIIDATNAIFDLRPRAIIHELGLRKPIYKNTACFGHFGRKDITFPWENLDKVNEIKEYFGIK